TLWLVRGGLRKGYTLYTRFPWGQSLKQGQAVQLAGVTVGFVDDVKLNRIGVIDVTLNVLNKYQVPNSAYAEVYPVGIFGDGVVAQDRNLTATIATLRGAVDSAQFKSTLAAFRQTAANADSLMQRRWSNTPQLQGVLARLGRGEGTACKLLTDSMLYRDTRNLL